MLEEAGDSTLCPTSLTALDAARQEAEIADDLLQPDLHRLPPGAGDRRHGVALTLKLLGGLTTEEIARAFLVPGNRRWRSASCAPNAA
jgi:predicted RNA polymerase sigma factor